MVTNKHSNSAIHNAAGSIVSGRSMMENGKNVHWQWMGKQSLKSILLAAHNPATLWIALWTNTKFEIISQFFKLKTSIQSINYKIPVLFRRRTFFSVPVSNYLQNCQFSPISFISLSNGSLLRSGGMENGSLGFRFWLDFKFSNEL